MKNENKSLSLLSMILTVCAMTVHHSTLMSMPYPHVHYSSTICLSQGQHAVYMCPDIILFNLHHTCIHHVYTMRNPCPLTLFPL